MVTPSRLVELFDAQANQTPHATALVDVAGSATWSYRELTDCVQDLARRLVRHEVGNGDVVMVCIDRSNWAVAALLAVRSIGAVYLPVEPSTPSSQTRRLFDQAPVRAVVSNDGIGGVEVSPRVRSMPALDDEVALLMYTSGTTGAAKGVLHAERQVVNRLKWMWQTYPFRAGDVMSQRSPLVVMPSMWELLGGLLAGVPTVVIPDDVVRDPQKFSAVLTEYAVTHVTLVPSLLRALVETRSAASTSLRMVTVGGEPMTALRYGGFRRRFPTATLLVDYGCTETNTITARAFVATMAECTDEDLATGYAIDDVEVCVLDEHQREVSHNGTGEVYVGGAGVALGYLGMDELTVQRFVIHPSRSEVRLYRTGDRAMVCSNGAVRLLGRSDNQVKINGIRVELEGVEAILNRHSGVRESAVVKRTLPNGKHALGKHALGNHALGAFVVLNPDTDLHDVREHLRAHHQGPMPSVLRAIDALPRTQRGKVDRNRLADELIPSADQMLSVERSLVGHPGTNVHFVNSQKIPVSGSDPAYRRILLNQSMGVGDVHTLVAVDVLGVHERDVDAETRFVDLGVDSFMVVKIARLVQERYGVELSVADVYDNASISALAREIDRRLGSALLIRKTEHETSLQTTQQVVPETHQAALAKSDASPAVAIIGMAGRFPGAPTVEALWQLVLDGRVAVDEVPIERWDASAFYHPDAAAVGKSMSRWGAFIDDVDRFDSLFFNIPPAHAPYMDPQQRVCLEESWKALEDAGYGPDALRDTRVGVFIGARKGDYVQRFQREGGNHPSGDVLLGSDVSMLSSLIAYHLDTHGPSLTIDTACSSSLVALHIAAQSIRNQECDVALVGGACIVTDPSFYVATSKLGIFSPTGACRPFDNDADGFVQGEGVAFVVLKSLERAKADGDSVRAIIRASAVNHDGRTNGIAAPSASAQHQLQSNTYAAAGIDARHIGYVEAHGTGTKLGDPIEVQALTQSFRQHTSDQGFCALGSLKANIGHLTAASGITGVIKATLCVQRGIIPPLANFRTPNDLLDLDASPFFIPTKAIGWEDPLRTAAVSSFGLGGTNAHCVVQQHVISPASPAAIASPAYLVTVSAHDEPALQRRVTELARWLEEHADDHCLADIAFTLANHQRFLYAKTYVSHSVRDLLQQLHDSQGNDPAQLMADLDVDTRDEVGDHLTTALAQWCNGDGDGDESYLRRLRALSGMVRHGYVLDARRLFTGPAQRVALPVYPFSGDRYWVPLPFDVPYPHASSATEPVVLRAVTNDEIELSDDIVRDVVRDVVTSAVVETIGLSSHALMVGDLRDYGLDSIRALSVKYRIEEALQCEVSVATVASSVTLEQLVTAVRAIAEQSSQHVLTSGNIIAKSGGIE